MYTKFYSWFGILFLLLVGQLNAQAMGKLLFAHEGNAWLMNPDGTEPVQLTHSPTIAEANYKISPDGTKILYAETELDLFIMDADGSRQRRIDSSTTHISQWLIFDVDTALKSTSWGQLKTLLRNQR